MVVGSPGSMGSCRVRKLTVWGRSVSSSVGAPRSVRGARRRARCAASRRFRVSTDSSGRVRTVRTNPAYAVPGGVTSRYVRQMTGSARTSGANQMRETPGLSPTPPTTQRPEKPPLHAAHDETREFNRGGAEDAQHHYRRGESACDRVTRSGEWGVLIESRPY